MAGASLSMLTAGAATALPAIRCGAANGWGTGVVGAASCPFALNVARAIDPSWVSSQFYIQVFSPVTGSNHHVTCHDATAASGEARAYECIVRDGVVYLWQ